MNIENGVFGRHEGGTGVPEVDLTEIESLDHFLEKYQQRVKERIVNLSPAQLSAFLNAVAEYGWDCSGEGNNGESSHAEEGERGDGSYGVLGLKFSDDKKLIEKICVLLNLQYKGEKKQSYGGA